MYNRRDFIRQSALAGAGLLLSPSVFSIGRSQSEKVVVGVVGTNSRGLYLARMFAQLPDIITDEKFGAFELTFDFKFAEGANSGVKYFVDEKYLSNGSAIGLEYQILDDARHPDAKEGVVGNRTLGSLYDLIPSIKIIDVPRIWNEGRIRVYPDNRIEHWLNGRKIVEYQRGTPIFYALVARSKYNVWEGFGMVEKGHILLQDHGDAVSFRSIKIRELK